MRLFRENNCPPLCWTQVLLIFTCPLSVSVSPPSLLQSDIQPTTHSINLTLFNVSRDDNNYQLTCIAENVVGMTNASVQLNVQCECDTVACNTRLSCSPLTAVVISVSLPRSQKL